MIMETIKKVWENRPFRTFIQAFIASLMVGVLAILQTVEVSDPVKALMIASVAAGLSAVMNSKK